MALFQFSDDDLELFLRMILGMFTCLNDYENLKGVESRDLPLDVLLI
jgi:hypothetical protein